MAALTQFQLICYKLLKRVPSGKVTTYKALAKAMGTKAYRAVGNAMKLNPFAPEVPCHRVVKSDGRVGNYSAEGRIKRKIELLRNEGIKIKEGKIELKKYLHEF